MNYSEHTATIEQALADNHCCTAGLFGSLRAYTKKDLDQPEMLAMMHLSDEEGCWYGYIGPSLHGSSNYVALVVRLNHFLNARNLDMLFGLFNQHMVGLSAYHPCKIQAPDDAFMETNSFPEAVIALAEMIKRFEPVKRDPKISSPFYMDPYELRCFDYFGFKRSF